MRKVTETLGALWQLLLLGVKTGFRLRGRYWRWRYETAFGSEPDRFTTRGQRWRAMLEYGRWLHRMKRTM